MESQTQQLTKTCTNCKVTKPVSDFNKHVETGDRLQSWCRHCNGKNSREYMRKMRRIRREEKEQQLAS